MTFDNRMPVAIEQSFDRLPVRGRLPAGLAGTLFRNGPNPCDPGASSHWFSGDGMIHAFTIGRDGVSYRNRWVRTQAWAEAQGLSLPSAPAGVANTNIISHGGQVLALEEAHLPVAMDPATLATLGARNFGGALPAGPFTAHPKHDPASGALMFFGYDADGQFTDTVRIGEIDAAGVLTWIETAQMPYAAMIHDFAVTARHVVIPLFPLIGYAWHAEQPSWLGVMDRALGVASLRWFRAPAGFAFHVMNAWDSGETIEIDLMVSAAPPFFPAADGTFLPHCDAFLCRWRLDLADPAAAATGKRLSDEAGEFPRIDDRFAGSRTRHGYFTSFGALCHRDEMTGRLDIFRLPAGDRIGEPVFAPAGPGEGEGWLLAVIFRAAAARSELAIFDALDVAAGPVASAHLPCRVPDGFHGNWVADADPAGAGA